MSEAYRRLLELERRSGEPLTEVARALIRAAQNPDGRNPDGQNPDGRPDGLA